MAYTTIDDPTDYFNTVIYTGNGNDDRDITGLDFQPDWLWSARRDSGDNRSMYDIVRGDGKELRPQQNSAELDRTNNIQSLNSNGFQVGDDSQVNASGGTYVSWAWSGGGSASSNSDGSITSSVSANTTAGFSIVSWTGTGSAATIGHGLGSVPRMIIVKNRDDTDNWYVYHVANGNTHSILLDTNGAKVGAYTDNWNNTTPTSSVFSVGGSAATSGASNEKMISYCFADVKGYSKIGKYTGNANTDGPMIHTGFRPSWVIIKNTAASEHWRIYDNKRDTHNHMYHVIYANESSVESTTDNASEEIDFLSNGIKIRSSAAQLNGSGQALLYMAFAESPFVNSNGVPTNAR